MNDQAASEYDNFDRAMEKILRADPKAVKEALKAEWKANAGKRKAKKRSSLNRLPLK